MSSPSPRRHLYEVEVVRLLTFAGVVAVHVLSYMVGSHASIGLALSLLHYTRGVFFALTAFLLVFGAYRRPQPLRRFWPRRFLLVGVPYVTWSAVYVLIAEWKAGWQNPPLRVLHSIWTAIAHGTSSEQMYFLLVTMQVYLVVPAIVALLRRFPRAHLVFLEVSFVFQFFVFLALHDYPERAAPIVAVLPVSAMTLFPSYLFFIVGGAVAGAHADAFLDWIRRRRDLVSLLGTASFLLTVGVFLVQMRSGMSPLGAATEMQPVEIPWSITVAIVLASAGAWWADRRRPGSLDDRVLAWASDRSFGIFLAHAAYITLFLQLGIESWPAVVRLPAAYVGVLLLSALTAEVFRRTPLSLPFTGRRMIRSTRSGGGSDRRRRASGRDVVEPADMALESVS